MEHLRYKFYSWVKNVGIYLEYSYKIHGYKQNKHLGVKRIGERLTGWAEYKIDRWILKNYGAQNSWGWTGSPLDGLFLIDDKEQCDKILNRKTGSNKTKVWDMKHKRIHSDWEAEIDASRKKHKHEALKCGFEDIDTEKFKYCCDCDEFYYEP